MERPGVSLSAVGAGVLGGAVVLYVLGVVLGYTELVGLAGAALFALAVGFVLVARRPRVTIARRLQPDRVTVGGRAQAIVTVTNRGRMTSPPFAAVDHVGASAVPVEVRRIAPGATVHVPYAVPATRRGRVRLGPVVVTRTDPLDLVRYRQPHASHQTLWIHPRSHAVLPVPTGMMLDLEGPLVETTARGALTFSSLREYVPGDDVRQIHWRSTARVGTLMVREHVDTSLPHTTVALDVRARLWTAAAFEEGVEAAASLVVAAERNAHPAVMMIGDAEPDGAGGDPPATVLDRLALAEVSLQHGQRLLDRLDQSRSGGAVILITGLNDGPTIARAAGLRRRFGMVILAQVFEGAPIRAQNRSGLVQLQSPTGATFAQLWNRVVGR